VAGSYGQRAVEQRIVEIVLGVGVDRIRASGRPDRDVVEFGKVVLVPGLQILRVRPHQDARGSHPLVAGGGQLPNPAIDKGRLVGRDETR